MESIVDGPQELARQVAGVIREVGIEVFRDAVRQVAAEHVAAQEEKDRREEARRAKLKETGVWCGHAKLPERPKAGAWCHWVATFRGLVKDRPGFDELKAAGFPSDQGGEGYMVDVEGWIPEELSPDGDPPTYDLLPIPKRGLTEPEKVAVLSAIHDAHRKGDEKIAPWGVSRNSDMPAAAPPEAELDECSKATWYHVLTREAREITSTDISLARDWIDAIRAKPLAGEGADVTGFLGGEDLAEALGVHPSRRGAFFRKLERKRVDLGDDCWHEVNDPRPNSPRFLYRADSPKLRHLAEPYKTRKPA